MKRASVFLVALVVGVSAAIARPAGGDAAVGTPAQTSREPIPLCRAPTPDALTAIAAKDDIAGVKKACDGLVGAASRSLHMENTAIWMGLWQSNHSGGYAIYTNRLDVAELNLRVAALTAELEAHIEQIQKMIRSQDTLAR